MDLRLQVAAADDPGPAACDDATHGGGAARQVPAAGQTSDQTAAAGLHDGPAAAAIQVRAGGCPLKIGFICRLLHNIQLPRWPSGYGVRLESRRSRVRILLVLGFFWGRVIPVT